MDGRIFIGHDPEKNEMAFANIRDSQGNDFTVKLARGKLTVERLQPHQDGTVPVWVTVYELSLPKEMPKDGPVPA